MSKHIRFEYTGEIYYRTSRFALVDIQIKKKFITVPLGFR